MKKGLGILVFACFAAFAFYVHFNKLAKSISGKSVKIEKVSTGQTEKIMNSNDCMELKKYIAHFVEVHGLIDGVSIETGKIIIKTGCLKIVVLKKLNIKKGAAIKVKGFLKERKGSLEIVVYDLQNLSISN